MSPLSCVPAILIAASAVLGPVGAALLPRGEATVLIPLAAGQDLEAEALVLARPAPGWALVHGDAGRLRAIAGLTILWDGTALCTP